MLSEKIWLNGKYLDRSKGIVNISTEAFHYGTSVFEGILCIMTKYGSAIFRLKDHIDRMFESSLALDFKITYSKEELGNAVINLIKINKYDSCYIRPIIFKDIDYLELGSKKGGVSIAILCKRFSAQMYQLQMMKRLRLMVSEKTRNPWTGNLARAKISGKYLNSVIARIEARENRFDDAILLDAEGMVSEATSSNIFLVENRVVKTPSFKNTLKGITQDSVMQIGRDLGYIIIEQDMKIDELYSADEVFLTNTAQGIISISQINSEKIIDSSHKGVAKILRHRYINTIKGKDPRYQEWLTYL